MGLTYKKFYYPLPSCEMTNVIFTDKHLPDEETISRNVVFNEADDIELNKENELYKDIIKQDKNLFKIFANCFLQSVANMNLKTMKLSLFHFQI